MNHTKIINHYMSLSRQLRDRIITEEQLQEIVERDVVGFDQMKLNGEINNDEYNAIIDLVSTYEDLFIDIVLTQMN